MQMHYLLLAHASSQMAVYIVMQLQCIYHRVVLKRIGYFCPADSLLTVDRFSALVALESRNTCI